MSPRRDFPDIVTDDPSPTVFIFCDEPTHKRRSAVTNFYQLAPVDSGDSEAGRWNERYASRARKTRDSDSGITLVNDRPMSELSRDARDDVWRKMGPDSPYKVRSGYVLECRRCNSRNRVVLREETLFSILNRLEAAGVSEVSLPGIRYIISSSTGQ